MQKSEFCNASFFIPFLGILEAATIREPVFVQKTQLIRQPHPVREDGELSGKGSENSLQPRKRGEQKGLGAGEGTAAIL